MTNYLYEHGKPLRHVHIYSDVILSLTAYINMTNHLFKHGKLLRRISSDVILS